MGDIADMLIENGIMELLSYDYVPESFAQRCKYCGVDQLEWYQLDTQKWRLVDREGKIHSCKEYYDDSAIHGG